MDSAFPCVLKAAVANLAILLRGLEDLHFVVRASINLTGWMNGQQVKLVLLKSFNTSSGLSKPNFGFPRVKTGSSSSRSCGFR